MHVAFSKVNARSEVKEKFNVDEPNKQIRDARRHRDDPLVVCRAARRVFVCLLFRFDTDHYIRWRRPKTGTDRIEFAPGEF